jgi:uncharacterized RDD family membrane protein YckC
MRYYLVHLGQRTGPFSRAELRSMVGDGRAGPGDLVWQEGTPDWQPLATLFPAPTVDDAHPSLAEIAPPAFAGESTPRDLPALASRGQRLTALSIDHLLAFAIMLPAIIATMRELLAIADAAQLPTQQQLANTLLGHLGDLGLVLGALMIVQAVLVTLRGQTIGKFFTRIRIVRSDGAPCGFVRGFFLRTVVINLICSIPFIGGVLAIVDAVYIFRPDHRCLHDHLADTIVVRVPRKAATATP